MNDSELNHFTITDFKINLDSSVTAHYGNEKTIGEWKWKQKKSLGNDNFNVEFNQDIVILSKFENQNFYLGLSLIEKNGKRYLSAGKDKLYEKK
jgi:hypothetical protein